MFSQLKAEQLTSFNKCYVWEKRHANCMYSQPVFLWQTVIILALPHSSRRLTGEYLHLTPSV